MYVKNGGIVTDTAKASAFEVLDPWTSQSLRVLVLGPFRVPRHGREVAAKTRQVGRVGSALATSPGVVISRDRIIEMVWGENPPSTAINTLQVHVSQLRSMVGRGLIATVGDGYSLDIEPGAVDAEWFKGEVLDCLDHGFDGRPESIRQRLEVALGAWRGEPFSDLNDQDVTARRSELLELRERAREMHLELSLQVAKSARAISEVIAAAKGQIARMPVREAAYRVLIGALIADGRPAEAADAYRSAVDYFQTSLGVKPSPQLEAALLGQF